MSEDASIPLRDASAIYQLKPPGAAVPAESTVFAPEHPLTVKDQTRLLRLLERTLGNGFKMAVIEVSSPVMRQAVMNWLCPHFERLNASVMEVNVASLSQQAAKEDASKVNLWKLLDQTIPPANRTPRQVLTLFGFEDLMYQGRQDRSELLQQINVQRDLFVRDFPCWWLLFIHPQSRQRWYAVAPDFCDFVACWVEATVFEIDASRGLTTPVEPSSKSVVSPIVENWPPDLRNALYLVENSDYDQALDLLHAIRARLQGKKDAERDLAIAAMIETNILFIRGETDVALERLRHSIVPAFKKLGDTYTCAVATDKIASILQRRGEYDEALRLWQEDILPVFEHFGDVRSKAVIMSKIADIRAQRGDTSEALRIWGEEVLPTFEGLADVREIALTKGKIADILHQRGETDEALRIRREEELPAYESIGNAREKAVTLGKIADILSQRGELDDALHTLREEVLPVFEHLGNVREKAVTMGKIADILQQRDETDEALRIRREEELPIYKRLGDVREKAATMFKIADILAQRCEMDEALRMLHEDVLPAFDRLGEVRSRAVTMGRIAIILEQRGETDEALRILREDVLPVIKHLGDMREMAATMGKIADILQQRGEADEALRIQIDERLPIAQKMGDMDSIARIRFSCAQIRLGRSGLEKGEVQIIYEELAESFSINMKLQHAEGIAAVGAMFGRLLSFMGKTDEAIQVLEASAIACEKLGWIDRASQVRALQAQIRNQGR